MNRKRYIAMRWIKQQTEKIENENDGNENTKCKHIIKHEQKNISSNNQQHFQAGENNANIFTLPYLLTMKIKWKWKFSNFPNQLLCWIKIQYMNKVGVSLIKANVLYNTILELQLTLSNIPWKPLIINVLLNSTHKKH